MITLELIKVHDPEALEQLRKQMFKFVRKTIRDYSSAEDVVQDSMIKVLANVHKFDGRYHVATWAMRIARNTAIDSFKNNKNSQLVSDIEISEEPVEETSRLQELRQAVDALPSRQRIVANLMVAGKSNKEISKTLGISIGNTYKKTFEVRKSLKEKLCHGENI